MHGMTHALHAQASATPSTRTLRVALVTETYPPEVNGVAGTVARVVAGMVARGHQLQLVRLRQHAHDLAHAGPQLQEVLMRGMPIPGYPQLRMGAPAVARLRALWRLQRPDVVHLATEGPLGWSALRAARQLGLPTSSDFRTNFQAYAGHYGMCLLSRPIHAYLRHFHNHTGCTMVPTTALRDTLAAGGLRRLEVVARGVDLDRFQPSQRSQALRHSWGADDGTTVALCVGRLAPEKNLGTVVAAFAAMQQVQPKAKLVFVGDGPARAEMQARCPGAHFAGQQLGSSLSAHYASADIFIFPSMTETFGNVTLEAMASGLPVLAYHHAAAAAAIDSGVNGVLVPLGQAGEFVRCAAHLARHTAAAREMGRRARMSAARWAWPQVLNQIEQVMYRVVDQTQALSAPMSDIAATAKQRAVAA
jgi:glycosyltransferase involved in cell wall biosynthesis